MSTGFPALLEQGPGAGGEQRVGGRVSRSRLPRPAAPSAGARARSARGVDAARGGAAVRTAGRAIHRSSAPGATSCASLGRPDEKPGGQVLLDEPRVAEERDEDVDLPVVEEGPTSARSASRARAALLPEREPRQLLEDAPVRRVPHGGRRPRLAADVDEVAPREVLEEAERVGAGRRRVERDGLAHLPAREEPRRREDLGDDRLARVGVAQAAEDVGLGEARDVLADEGRERRPVGPRRSRP